MTGSKKIDDGGHAYPVCFEGGQNSGEAPYFHEGMSLRDWFAGQALACIPLRSWDHVRDTDRFEAWAKAAYLAADAMISARKGGA